MTNCVLGKDLLSARLSFHFRPVLCLGVDGGLGNAESQEGDGEGGSVAARWPDDAKQKGGEVMGVHGEQAAELLKKTRSGPAGVTRNWPSGRPPWGRTLGK